MFKIERRCGRVFELLGYAAVGRMFESRLVSTSNCKILSVSLAVNTLVLSWFFFKMQSTLIISKLKGPSETLRDIRTSTYQIFKAEENTNRTTKFQK